MRCDEVADLLSRRRRRLGPARRGRRGATSSSCLRCQAELVQYRKLLRALRAHADRGARAGARACWPTSSPTSRRRASASASRSLLDGRGSPTRRPRRGHRRRRPAGRSCIASRSKRRLRLAG